MEQFSFSPASLFRFLTLASAHRLTEHELTAIIKQCRDMDTLVTVASIERIATAVLNARMFNRVAR